MRYRVALLLLRYSRTLRETAIEALIAETNVTKEADYWLYAHGRHDQDVMRRGTARLMREGRPVYLTAVPCDPV